MTPNQTAGLIASASGSNPGGGGPAVSGSGNESLISRWSGYVKSLAERTVGALKPGSLLVPGGTEATKAAARTAESAAVVAESAGEGIKSGFKMATFVVVLLVGLFLWKTFKPS